MADHHPYGNDTLIIPAYLASDETCPKFLAWKREHPDSFIAGTWTRKGRPAAETTAEAHPPAPTQAKAGGAIDEPVSRAHGLGGAD